MRVAHLLCKLVEKKSKFDLYDTCLIEIGELKNKLVSAPIAIALDLGEPIAVMCNASGVALGKVLGQRCEKTLHPIYYILKALNTKKNFLKWYVHLQKF